MTDSLHSLRLKWSALSLFRGVLDDEIGWRLRDVLEYLADGDDATASIALEAIDAYASAASLLQAEASLASSHPAGDLWQEHLLDRLLLDTNLLSAAAERGTGAPLSPALRTKARAELRGTARASSSSPWMAGSRPSLRRLRSTPNPWLPSGRPGRKSA